MDELDDDRAPAPAWNLSTRAVLLMALLVGAAGLVAAGVACWSAPLALIVAGVELAVLAVFGLADL